ncbi:hypothetical protein GCM10009525_71480 [Streptosporangium amethystogenes subsp. fukuiense]
MVGMATAASPSYLVLDVSTRTGDRREREFVLCALAVVVRLGLREREPVGDRSRGRSRLGGRVFGTAG